jgi:hypothetical protein
MSKANQKQYIYIKSGLMYGFKLDIDVRPCFIGVVLFNRADAIEADVNHEPAAINGEWWAHWEEYEYDGDYDIIPAADVPDRIKADVDAVVASTL